jgi:hypothetical protein
LSRTKERKRQPPDVFKTSGPGSFPLRRSDKPEELKQALEKQKELQQALQNRLEALAWRSKKGGSHVVLAMAQIWPALDSEQARLAPSMNTQIRTTRAIRNWRLGKPRDWVQGERNPEWREREVNYAVRIDPHLAAGLVRHGFLLRERGRSEEQAVEEAAGVKEADLSATEHRAFEMVTGKRGFTRTNPKDRAVPLAKAVLKDWLPSEPACRLLPPTKAPSLTIEKIVHIVVPFLDELAGRQIGHSAPYRDEDDPAKINPPALGALLAIARMAHLQASLEHVRHSIRSYRGLNLTPANGNDLEISNSER